MRTLPTAMKKRPGLLIVWLVLLLAIPFSFGAFCSCDENEPPGSSKLEEKNFRADPQPGGVTESGEKYENAIKANFTGTSRNYGIGSCINGAPIYVNQGTVWASKQVAIDEQIEDGWTKGTETYKLEGTIDPETLTIEATITRTMDSTSSYPEWGGWITHKYTATLKLVALRGEGGTGWKGEAVGKETWLETTETGNDWGGTVESDLDWEFEGHWME